MDILTLIKALQGASNVDVTINVTKTEPEPTPTLPDTDFAVGDEVLVCHIKKDGSGTKHVVGTVTDILQKDDVGYYTRVLGENGKHYRIGLKFNEERLGSKAIVLEN